jgi:hypothetical protein
LDTRQDACDLRCPAGARRLHSRGCISLIVLAAAHTDVAALCRLCWVARPTLVPMT